MRKDTDLLGNMLRYKVSQNFIIGRVYGHRYFKGYFGAQETDIVFDRSQLEQNYSKAIKNQCRIEFRKANKSNKKTAEKNHKMVNYSIV